MFQDVDTYVAAFRNLESIESIRLRVELKRGAKGMHVYIHMVNPGVNHEISDIEWDDKWLTWS